MNFMDKNLEDIVVTLPFADGTSMDCGVFSYFEVNGKKYFALLKASISIAYSDSASMVIIYHKIFFLSIVYPKLL